MYTAQDVRNAYFAHGTQNAARANGVTAKDEIATMFSDADVNLCQRQYGEGAKTLREAKLKISSRYVTGCAPLGFESALAPIIEVDAGYIATSEARRMVTLSRRL